MPNLEQILGTFESISKDVITVDADLTDQNARWPERAIRIIQQEGLAGLVIPEKYGGLGCGLYALARVSEIIGKACGSTGLCFAMHCVGSAVVATAETDSLRKRFLEPISQGEHITTLALSEAGTGSHFYLPQTTLKAVDHDQYLIQGTKSFCTSAAHADSYVVSTVADEVDAPIGQFSCVMVEADTNGISYGPEWSGLGMRGNSSRSVILDKIYIPKTNILGNEGDEIHYIFNVIAPYFMVALSGVYLGITQAALDIAKAHMLKRNFSHSGTSLAQQPILQHRLGILMGMIERTRSLIYRAAQKFDNTDTDAVCTVMLAKAEVADCVTRVVNEVMTLCGGIAYQDGSKLHLLLRNARAVHVMSPTTDILRTWAGRALLDLPLLGD